MCLSNEVFINPFTDFGFKRIFGEEESKPFLISFLNDLLPIKDKIKSITFQNTEQFGASPEDRKAIFDLYCVDESGRDFIVELQRAEQRFFIDRALYYTTFPIQTQASRGVWNFELKPIYFIGILNFEVNEFKNDDNYIHYCQIIDIDKKNIVSEKLNFIYIEIPKFKKTKEELSKHLEWWLYYLRDLNELTEIPKEIEGDIIEDAFKRAEFLKLSNQEQHNYHINLKHFRDWVNTLDTAIWKGEQKGIEKGKKEGIKEGEKQAKIEIARNLLDILDIETISLKTGLSVEEIQNLQNIS